MNLMKVVQRRQAAQRFLMTPLRAFGAGGDPNHVYKKISSSKDNTTVKVPSDADYKAQIAEKYIINDKF